MSFRGVLNSIRERVDGTLAVSLIGADGITVDGINPGRVPLDVMGAEFSSFIKSIRLSTLELNTGQVLQFSLVTEKYTAFVSAVTPDYFVVLVTAPEGNYGRARFELARAKQLLGEELS